MIKIKKSMTKIRKKKNGGENENTTRTEKKRK